MQAIFNIARPNPFGYVVLNTSGDPGRPERRAFLEKWIVKTNPITLLLREWQDGNGEALDRLVPLVYDELRRLARREIRRDRPGHTLQPTELVHDAYARLVDVELSWQDRMHFFRMAAKTMRRVLVDHGRARRAAKRGGGAVLVTLDEAEGRAGRPASDVLDLADALERLADREERLSQAVELFYFGGLTYREIATALEVSPATVDRDLRFARAWLRRELAPAADGGDGRGG